MFATPQFKPSHPIEYANVAAKAGLQFQNDHGSPLPLTIVETSGGGCGFFDYDNDGWLDVYLISEAKANALFRNNHDGTFTDVTEKANAGAPGHYHMGCSAADVDNDGNIDLYLTNYDTNILLRNTGRGTFEDTTKSAQVGDKRWSLGSAFLDFNRDGLLDLYVANYVDFTKGPRLCDIEGAQMNCPPFLYPRAPDTLYRNKGSGTFADVSKQAGILASEGRGMGVTCFDYNNDGLTDIHVANDADANTLWRNRGNGTFEDTAMFAGVAYSQDGRAGASMGIDFADCDFDGHFDFVVTNFQHEVYTFYRNMGTGMFSEETDSVGLAEPTLPYLGWGVGFIDFDNDGDKDLFFANGHVRDNVREVDKTTSFPQRQQLFENRDGEFVELSQHAGTFFHTQVVGRGAAFGDYDNDGDVDILINSLGGQTALLRNDGGNQNNWIEIQLIGNMRKGASKKGTNRSAVGSRVVVTADGRRQMDEVRAGGSYISFNDLRLHFGLAKAAKVDIEVRWLSGKKQFIKGAAANRLLIVHEDGPVEERTMPLASSIVKN